MESNSKNTVFPEPLNRCFACFRFPEEYFHILDAEQSIAELLVQHFWFQREDFKEEHILCHSCWNQLDSFHRFFAEVEQNHRKQESNDIKQECIETVEVKVEIKQESYDYDESASSGEEFNPQPEEEVNSSTSESDAKFEKVAVTEQKRKYVRREKSAKPDLEKRANYAKSAEQLAEEDEIIKTHVKYICDNCGLNCPTFTSFQKHMEGHGVKGNIR